MRRTKTRKRGKDEKEEEKETNEKPQSCLGVPGAKFQPRQERW